MPKTLGQKRAKHAWDAVQGVLTDKSAPEGAAKEYGTHAKKLPLRIRTAGLGSALAFLRAKAEKKGHLKRLHRDLTDWVIGERGLPAKHRDDLLQSIVDGESDFLRRATDESMAYLEWLNRFAEAEGLTREED
ncbi:MAG: type III-B CRISPR module-associated protein Cmr5 [Myxococcota bacterium]|nr:type III-B CRISPR module-associated protein Cmr5 [Myxococcota bacterium]